MLGGLWTKNWEFGPKTHVKYLLFIEILADIRLRIWVDLLNYINPCRILFSIDWRQVQGVLSAENAVFGEENPPKMALSMSCCFLCVFVC